MNMRTLILAAALTTLAACGGGRNTLPETAPVDNVPPASAGSASGVDDVGSGRGQTFGETVAGGALSDGLIVYFDFDESEVKPQYTDQIAAHARNLASNPGLRVRLEGHADERGSREYNIGLGERRAQAVRRILLIQGASAGQISTVSFGEERPAVVGSSEDAYAKNRRVELNYIN